MACHILSLEHVKISPVSEKQLPHTALPVGSPPSREGWLSSPKEKLASRPGSVHVHTIDFICLHLCFFIYKVMGPYSPSFIYWLIHSFIYYTLSNLASISSPLGVHHPMCSQRSKLPVQSQCVKCGDGRMLGRMQENSQQAYHNVSNGTFFSFLKLQEFIVSHFRD